MVLVDSFPVDQYVVYDGFDELKVNESFVYEVKLNASPILLYSALFVSFLWIARLFLLSFRSTAVIDT